MTSLEKRVIVPELLDIVDAETAAANLGDLRFMNRWFGGYSILTGLVGEWYERSDHFTVLDVGAASGDMGQALKRAYPNATVVSIDHQFRNLAVAPHPKLAGDAFRLPFRDRSFDLVFCSLFLHHFEDGRVSDLLRGMHRLSRRALLAIDLERSVIARAFLPATRWAFRWQAVTMYDGPVSVEAAFSPAELHKLALDAGLHNAKVRRHLPWFRLSISAAANEPS